MTHAAWDDGAITGEGKLLGQKTVKTKCGKRVGFNRITADSFGVDCRDCRDVLNDEAIGRALIDRSIPR